MSIQIKDYSVVRGVLWRPFHPKLVALAMWVSARYSDMCITSGYREGDSGVHGTIPCRGLDIRSRTFSCPAEVVADINQHWKYNHPKQAQLECALLHGEGLNQHIHLQVRDETEYLGG